MDASGIKKHFQGLRVDSARRRGRGRDPFATGFEDDSVQDTRDPTRSRSKTQTSPSSAKAASAAVTAPSKNSISSPFAAIDALNDSDDDFLSVGPKRTDRRPSPAPAGLQKQAAISGAPPGRRGSIDTSAIGRKPQRSAKALAAGSLAYLDDSSDEDLRARPTRADRAPSPAPATQSPPSETLRPRSSSPRSERGTSKERAQAQAPTLAPRQPPRHTVASPFAGTKYLEDSSSDEEAVTSRANSVDADAAANSNGDSVTVTREIPRAENPKHNGSGSGVSWRTLSAGRHEQRAAEFEALQATLQRRGRKISFSAHATTDDGQRVPLSPSSERGTSISKGQRRPSRSKSPPRRPDDTLPADDELADGAARPIEPPESAPGLPTASQAFPSPGTRLSSPPGAGSLPILHQMSGSTVSQKSESEVHTPVSPADLDSFNDSIANKLVVSPQTIPETAAVDHSMSPVLSPVHEESQGSLSRADSSRSLRAAGLSSTRPARIPSSGALRRASRRSTSATTSVSPAHAFLSSWGRGESPSEAVQEPQPDDEGQAIGLNSEYIIGRTISSGGFGVVKEVHTLDENGHGVARAVKIIRKNIPDVNEMENEKVQQDLEHEVSVWRYLKHRHILSLHAVYDTDFATFCIMDLNVGGTLFDLVRQSRATAVENYGRKGLPSHLAKIYAYQLACALRYLHEDIRVCHRDVKLENCLIDVSHQDALEHGGNLRLCDFGLADFLHNDRSSSDDMSPAYAYNTVYGHGRGDSSLDVPMPTASSIIGTLEYASPKGLSVHRKLYETAGDVWAFGVIVYTLCTGELPFRHAMPSKTAELILRAEWDDSALRQVAPGGATVVLDLVRGCLERDIDLRFNIADVLRSSWFDGARGEESRSARWG